MFFKDKDIYGNRYGIYKITCLKNGRVYIGQTGSTFYKRYSTHKSQLNHCKHSNKAMQSDYCLYYDEFVFEVIEVCEKKNELIRLEAEAICKQDPGKCYNLLTYENSTERASGCFETRGLDCIRLCREKDGTLFCVDENGEKFGRPHDEGRTMAYIKKTKNAIGKTVYNIYPYRNELHKFLLGYISNRCTYISLRFSCSEIINVIGQDKQSTLDVDLLYDRIREINQNGPGIVVDPQIVYLDRQRSVEKTNIIFNIQINEKYMLAWQSCALAE